MIFKYLRTLLVLLLPICLVSPAYANATSGYYSFNSDAIVFINGKELALDEPLLEMNGYVLLPLRKVIESIGGTVHWDSKEMESSLNYCGYIVKISPKTQNTILENGKLWVSPQFINESNVVGVMWSEKFKTFDIRDLCDINQNRYEVTTNADQALIREENEKYKKKLENVKKMAISITPELEHVTDHLEIAELLRNQIYKHVPLKNTSPGFDFKNLDESYRLSLFDPDYGHICEGLSITYLTALKSFGIQARLVSIFEQVVNGPTVINAHATVEVFYDGEWIAQDPTFNFSIEDANGKKIGWKETYENIKAGNTPQFVDDGFGYIKGRSISEYYIGVEELTKYLTFSVSLDNNGNIIKPEIYPNTWDGFIYYSNGHMLDYVKYITSNIYETLSRDIAPGK